MHRKYLQLRKICKFVDFSVVIMNNYRVLWRFTLFSQIQPSCVQGPNPCLASESYAQTFPYFLLTIEKSFVFLNNDNLVNKRNDASIGFSFSFAPAFLNTAFSPVQNQKEVILFPSVFIIFLFCFQYLSIILK